MKQKKRKLNAFVKPLSVLTLLGLASMAQAEKSPFAMLPLHLQNFTTTTAGVVKPNVLIQFDDSGSMAYNIDGSQTQNVPLSQQRMTIAKNGLKTIVQDPKYKDAMNWGLISLWDNRVVSGRVYSSPANAAQTALYNSSYKYMGDFLAGRRGFALNPDTELLPMIDSLYPAQGTPAAERYLDAMHMLRAALDRNDAYRCQRSYIILFSDGDAQGALPQPTVNNNTFTPSTTSALATPYTAGRLTYHFTGYTWFPLLSAGKTYSYDLSHSGRFVTTPPPTIGANSEYPFNLINQNVTSILRQSGSNYLWNQGTNRYWQMHPDTLPFLASLVNKSDLKIGGVDAAGKSWDEDAGSGFEHHKTQVIETYAIGFGSGLSVVGDYALKNMSTGNNYQHLSASSEAELKNAFDIILSKINEANKAAPPSSVATISPSVSSSETDSSALNSAASVHLDVGSGSSEIRFYSLTRSSADKNASYSPDTSSYSSPDFSERKFLINVGGADNRVNWFDGNFAGNNAMFGITSQNTNEWRDSLMPWMTRSKDDSLIASTAGNSFSYRIRSTSPKDTRNMGDVIAASLTSAGETRYGRERFLVTAANDGMVYLFESNDSTTHPYKLKLNYLPAGMQRENANDTVMTHFKDIAHAEYTKNAERPHVYLLNGDFSIRTTDNSGPQRIFMSGNMGQAGRGSYSLNLAGVKRSNNEAVGLDATNWLTSVPLFETPKTSNNMGYTIGAPQIGRISKNRSITYPAIATADAKAEASVSLDEVYYATFVNSGIAHPTAKERTESALYVYNTLGAENVGLGNGAGSGRAGDLFAKLTASPTGGGLAPATLVDTNFDGVVDVAYAGDYGGGMYRFDLRGAPNEWRASKLFQTQTGQPITSAPAVLRNSVDEYVVIFGTGSDVFDKDLDDKTTQSVYGIYDNLNRNPNSNLQAQIGELLQQRLGLATSSGNYRTRDLTTNEFNKETHKGWYYNLPVNTGERVTVKPTMLLKTVLLSTRIYESSASTSDANDQCVATSSKTSQASSWVMQFRGDTGGKLPDEGEEDADLFGYVDFAGLNTEGKYKNRPHESMVSGFQYNDANGIFSYSMILGGSDPNQIGNYRNSTDLHGGINQAGTDAALIQGGTEVQMCVNGSEVGQLVGSNSGDSTGSGINTSNTVYVKTCAVASLKRISWREIF